MRRPLLTLRATLPQPVKRATGLLAGWRSGAAPKADRSPRGRSLLKRSPRPAVVAEGADDFRAASLAVGRTPVAVGVAGVGTAELDRAMTTLAPESMSPISTTNQSASSPQSAGSPRSATSPRSASSPQSASRLFSRPRPVPRAALARRARRVLVVGWLGVALAAVGAVATVLASFLMLRGRDAAVGGAHLATVWPTTGNLASVLVLLSAATQVGVWTAAERAWSGRRDFSGAFWLSTSTTFVWIGSASAVVVAVAARHQLVAAHAHDRIGWLVLVGAAAAVLGAALAATQRFRTDPRPMVSRRQRRTSKR